MSEPDVRLGLRSREVCDLLRMAPSTLNYWVQIGLVRPSLRAPQGRRVEQLWSVEDVVAVRTVRQLRTAGCPLAQVRRAARAVTGLSGTLGNSRLYWDGRDVYVQTEGGDVISTARKPGQFVWLLAVLPLGKWHADAEKRASLIDLSEVRARDAQRRRRQRTAAEPTERIFPEGVVRL